MASSVSARPAAARMIARQYITTAKTTASQARTILGVDASENDIIQYNGSAWTVVFDASSQSSTSHFLHNTFTSKQYKWTGSAWISSYEGEYNPGFWRLVL